MGRTAGCDVSVAGGRDVQRSDKLRSPLTHLSLEVRRRKGSKIMLL